MDEQSTESISDLLDGALDERAARAVVEAFDGSDAARLRDRWTRYTLIGDALRGNSTPDDGFTRRILERLARARREP